MITQNFSSVLVANRGEIALRIMKTARQMGLRCIAIYTDSDADAPHAAYADQAVRIGSGPVAESYLSIAAVIEAAKVSGAEAIHPGYGFLSENTEFAKACTKAGIVFVGPPAEAVEVMGNKAAAKTKMIEAGVPCVPGYEGAAQSEAVLAREAGKIGYPVMIKAAAGGGGRGMRLVASADQFKTQLALAKSEALNAFGSDEMILEKAILRPRHVEIQVFADRHGSVLHLGERDCSVQRRHQKVVEEAPCPVLTTDQRAAMGKAAVEAARAVNYVGAGTVEFLLDQDGAFFFLEMNTRLQVEHPVTEMVTGRDLVKLQFNVAKGLPLGFDQDAVTLSGHAIEVRLYAEDPLADFLPATGAIRHWAVPELPGIRIDAGVRVGQEVSPFYDPMLAKIIGWGETREEARQRLLAALKSAPLLGMATNRDFLIDVLERPDFISGQATTAFIAETYSTGVGAAIRPDDADFALLAAETFRADRDRFAARAVSMTPELLNWSSGAPIPHVLRFTYGDAAIVARVLALAVDQLEVTLNDRVHIVTGVGDALRIDGERADIKAFLTDGDRVHLATSTRCLSVSRHRPGARADSTEGADQVRAPMHGNLVSLSVKIGDPVKPGDPLAVLEAMKMQHEILAEVSGTIETIPNSPPCQVQAGDLIVGIKLDGGRS